MTRKFHNHRPQTKTQHRAEEPQNIDSHITIKAKHSSLFLEKMITKLEGTPIIKPQNGPNIKSPRTMNKQ